MENNKEEEDNIKDFAATLFTQTYFHGRAGMK